MYYVRCRLAESEKHNPYKPIKHTFFSNKIKNKTKYTNIKRKNENSMHKNNKDEREKRLFVISLSHFLIFGLQDFANIILYIKYDSN